MIFGLLAAFLWLGWLAMNFGWPAKLAERSAYFSPYYVPDFDWMPMIVAVLFTPLWVLAVRRRKVRGRQAVTNWAAGMTLVWALLMTVFLPRLDAAKSYRPVVERMEAAAPAALKSGTECLAVARDAYAVRTAWGEYGSLPLAVGGEASCRYRLIRSEQADEAAPAGWRVLWQGARPRSKNEFFRLLEKQEAV